MNLQREVKHKSEDIERVSASLDLTPYRDEKDFGLLQPLVCEERSS